MFAHAEHTCLWNGCRSSFSSLAELVSHVNLSHLSVNLSEHSDPFAPSSSCIRFSSEALGLSCQWDNCHEYSSAPSGGLAFDTALNSLTGHLLHDHLGLQGAPRSHNAVTADDATIASTISPIQDPDVEMQDRDQHSHPQSDKQDVPSNRNVKQCDVAEKLSKDERSLSAEDKRSSSVLDGTEKCCWGECGLWFASVDDLMSHLTTDHVGSGKNHYECFWSNCERSGKKGFSSKQKVCRHLQVRICLRVFRLPK